MRARRYYARIGDEMTLPTRNQGARGARSFRRSYEGLTPSGVDLQVQAILDAYADGSLLTAAEWRDTIDYEAAANKVRELDTKTVPAWKIAKAVVDVALGGDDE